MKELRPPVLCHIRFSKHDDYQELADKAAKAIHMSKGERNLLKYYAAQSSGFSPSLKAAANATDQDRSQVWRNRQKMIDQGFALMVYGPSGSERFLIDWSRLKLYASLDPQKTSKKSKYLPMVPPNEKPKHMSTFELRYAPMEEVIAKLSAMTPEQYEHLVRSVRA